MSDPSRADAQDRLARSWDEAADGYEEYFVPRFAPWVDAAVAALGAVPDGPVLVPCCGTFPELPALVRRLPDHELVGIDLSPGMVRRAHDRTAGNPRADAVVGDASTLDPRWSGRCAGVVSVFGLQQLPDPSAALRNWVGALRPGGRLSVMLWPDLTETEGPFALQRQILSRHLPGDDADPGDDAVPADGLAAAVTATGAVLERDEPVAFPITHPDAAAYWTALTTAGPLRALAIARGDDFMNRVGGEFLAAAPAGPWTHRPRARLLVAARIP